MSKKLQKPLSFLSIHPKPTIGYSFNGFFDRIYCALAFLVTGSVSYDWPHIDSAVKARDITTSSEIITLSASPSNSSDASLYRFNLKSMNRLRNPLHLICGSSFLVYTTKYFSLISMVCMVAFLITNAHCIPYNLRNNDGGIAGRDNTSPYDYSEAGKLREILICIRKQHIPPLPA